MPELLESTQTPERMRAVTHLARVGKTAIAADQEWEGEIRRFITEDASITDPVLIEKSFGAYRQARDLTIGQFANNYDAALLRYAAKEAK